MKRKKYSESQIVRILQEAETGVPVTELSRRYGFSQSAFYRWRAKYSGMDVAAVQRLKALEEENRRLKQMYANLSLEHEILKDLLRKKD